MNTYFLLYDSFSGFELSFPAFVLRNTNLVTVGLEKGPITSEEKLKYMPDIFLADMDVDKVDAFIIPGGSALKHLKDGSLLQEKLNQLNEKGKIIASVCGGPVLFSNTTILENKRYVVGGDHKLPENWMKPFTTGTLVNEDVVVDGNLITAKMEAIVSFAIAIGKELNIFANEEEEKRTFKMLQNIR